MPPRSHGMPPEELQRGPRHQPHLAKLAHERLVDSPRLRSPTQCQLQATFSPSPRARPADCPAALRAMVRQSGVMPLGPAARLGPGHHRPPAAAASGPNTRSRPRVCGQALPPGPGCALGGTGPLHHVRWRCVGHARGRRARRGQPRKAAPSTTAQGGPARQTACRQLSLHLASERRSWPRTSPKSARAAHLLPTATGDHA
mmetsp:Transcript_44286/g.111301  ORF Transcript_44286/g.111301 Transcript_44286/m.111301 type:complete len:201 (+) Transcript_44286:1616-2218(+)